MASEELGLQTELRDLQSKRDRLTQLSFELRDAQYWRDIDLAIYRSDFPNSWQKSILYKEREAMHQCIIDPIEKQIKERWQDLQKNYGITPGNKTELNRAIEEMERLVEREESAIPGYGMAERKAAKLAALAEAQQQAAPEPSQPGAAPPPSRDTPTIHHERERQAVTRETQVAHNEEFQRLLDQYYERQPPSQPTPAPQQVGHLKDLQPTKTEQEQPPPPTETKPTSHQHQKIPLIDHFKDDTPEEEHQPAQEHEPTDTQEDTRAGWEALKQAIQQETAHLEWIAQEVKQLNDDMTREQQQGKSGARKIPLRELYDLGPEPPSPQGPERDRDR